MISKVRYGKSVISLWLINYFCLFDNDGYLIIRNAQKLQNKSTEAQNNFFFTFLIEINSAKY